MREDQLKKAHPNFANADEFAKDRKANVPSVKADGTMQRLGNTEVQRAGAQKMQGPGFAPKEDGPSLYDKLAGGKTVGASTWRKELKK